MNTNKTRFWDLFRADFNHDATALVAGKAGLGGFALGSLYGAVQNFYYAYPAKVGLPNLMRCGSLGAVYGAVYCGVFNSVAKARHQKDWVSAASAGFATGFVSSLRHSKLVKTIGFSAFGAILAVTFYGITKDLELYQTKSLREITETNYDSFYDWPRPDPFKRRWEELKAKGLPGTKLE